MRPLAIAVFLACSIATAPSVKSNSARVLRPRPGDVASGWSTEPRLAGAREAATGRPQQANSAPSAWGGRRNPNLVQRLSSTFSQRLSASAVNYAFQTRDYRLDKAADAMGSTFAVALYGSDRGAMEAAADAALAEAQRLDALLSNYRPESEWSRVNRTAAHGPVPVSEELFQLLAACLAYSRESEGAFDITVGPLMRVWGFYQGTGHLAPLAEVAAALRKTGYRHVHLDAAGRTVWFDSPGVELDPGGIGKGYAVDRMVDILRKRGVERALVAGSDSSLYGLGAPPGEPRGWEVPIRDPRDARRTAGRVFLKDSSLSTSGTTEKFFRADGRVYSHLMDPRTGYPAQGTLSVSVLAPRTIDSEAWAKPYFVNGLSWTEAHRRPEFRVFLCPDAVNEPCHWLP